MHNKHDFRYQTRPNSFNTIPNPIYNSKVGAQHIKKKNAKKNSILNLETTNPPAIHNQNINSKQKGTIFAQDGKERKPGQSVGNQNQKN